MGVRGEGKGRRCYSLPLVAVAVIRAIFPRQLHKLAEGVFQEQLGASIPVIRRAKILGAIEVLEHAAAAFLTGPFVPLVDVGIGVPHGADKG